MKKLFLTLLALSSSLFALQAQSWLWGSEPIPKGGEGDVLFNRSVVCDQAGNSYFTGCFINKLTFGISTLNAGPSTSDIFFAKCDKNGNLLWGRQATAINSNSGGLGFSIALDGAGNIYETGYYTDTISFGPFGLKPAKSNMFLSKYDLNGNILWVKQSLPVNKSSSACAFSVACDKAGAVYLTGSFYDSVLFDSYMLITPTPTCEETFVVKYDSNGNVLWAKQSIGNNSNSSSCAYSLAIDNKSNIYVGGFFTDTVSFGLVKFIEASVNAETFLVKYDSSGTLLWGKQSTGATASSYSGPYSVAVDGPGNVYVTGSFVDTVSFGANKLITDISGGDVFLAKYDPLGNAIWAKQGFGPVNGDWVGFSVACDTLSRGGGYLEVSGGGPSSPYKFSFGNDTLSLNSYNSLGTVILQFDSDGNTICGTIFSEGNEDDGDGIASDKTGTFVFLAGDLVDTAIFGKDTLDYGIYSDEPFIARWQPCDFSEEGVNDVKTNSEEVRVYPNPSKGVYAFEVKSEELRTKSLVEVYNMLGEKIYSDALSIQNLSTGQVDSKFKIDLTAQPSGIYLYRVTSEDGDLIGTGKLIKE